MKTDNFYIVWNVGRTEGFITNEFADAEHAAGIDKINPCSSVADDFRSAYFDGDDGDGEIDLSFPVLEIQTINRSGFQDQIQDTGFTDLISALAGIADATNKAANILQQILVLKGK